MPDKKPFQELMPLYFFITLLALFSACGLLGSDDKEPLEPGPRNYEWTVDSVYSAPGGWMNTIWGSSPNDVCIASGSGIEKVWHFDGSEWSPYAKRRLPGSFYSIYGFSEDNVWMGSSGYIFHYNGNEWSEYFKYSIPGMSEPWINDVWGVSENNIYGIGGIAPESGLPYRGFVLYFNGKQWNEVLVTDIGVQLQVVRQSRQGLFIQGIKINNIGTEDTLVLYKLEKDRLKELIALPVRNENDMLFGNTIGEDYYIVNRGNLQKYSRGSFRTILEVFGFGTVYSVFGRHEKDLFMVTDAGIVHYNGTDIRLLIDTGAHPSAMLFEEEVFFFKNDFSERSNVIYHGVLVNTETR